MKKKIVLKIVKCKKAQEFYIKVFILNSYR